MKLFDKILCPIDFSEDSVKALQWSQHFVKKNGSQLTILHVMEPYPVAVDVGIDYDKYHAAVVRDMRAFLAPLDVPHQTLQSSGPPSDKIASLATTLGSTLIVMSTRGLHGAAHSLIGSTTESVIRHATVPVMTLSPQCVGFNQISSNRVLLPVSNLDWPIPGSLRFRQILRDLNGPLTLMHVLDQKEHLFHSPFGASIATNHSVEDGVEALRRIGVHMSRNNGQPQTIFQPGEPWRNILQEAEPSHFGWVLMGAKRQKSFSRFFGSTVYNTISRASVPVITVGV